MALMLGIESSCDETAAAVVENGRTVRSNAVSSQMAKHAVYGGVVPELAAREHLTAIEKVCAEALDTAGVTMKEIDAVAVTHAPGLVPALLVGVNFAKGLAFANGKPLGEQAPLLSRKLWESWLCKKAQFEEKQISPFKKFIEEINTTFLTP